MINPVSSDATLPESAVLELTYNCNHRCKFCSCPWENVEVPPLFYEKHEELSVDEWKRALRILDRSGVGSVTITGGEPLLKAGFAELLRYIREKTSLNHKRKIIVISNASAMSEAYISLFKETGVHLSLSLPGLTTYSYHTGTADSSPENVLHWLRRACEESIETTVNVTVTRKNCHELYETLANGLIAGAGTVLLNRFLVGGRGLTYQNELSLSPEELRVLLDTAEGVLASANRVGSVGTEYPLCLIPDGGTRYKHLRTGSLCAAANGFFVIDPSGYIRTCNHSPKRVGHIFCEPIISDLVYWNVFAQRAFDLPEMCGGCGFREECDCGCREAASICSGSHAAPDPCFSVFQL